MSFRDRELAELRRIYAGLSGTPEVPLADSGEINLKVVNTWALLFAQNRALGAMLDEMTAPKKRKVPARRR